MNLESYRITIDPQDLRGGAATIYSHKVREHLNWIYRTKTGKILLNSIRFHRIPLVIRPYTEGDCNARGGEDATSTTFRGLVEYSPNTFSLHGACSATQTSPNRGLFWDEVLFHELVHVFRTVSKKWNTPSLGFGLRRYKDNEEFIGVMVTNIYISDSTNKIKTGFRADSKSFNPLSTDFDDAFEFFSTSMQTFGLVEKFCNENPGFTRRLATDLADTQFNPLRDYYSDPVKARKMSQNAAKRDIAGAIMGVRDYVKGIFKF